MTDDLIKGIHDTVAVVCGKLDNHIKNASEYYREGRMAMAKVDALHKQYDGSALIEKLDEIKEGLLAAAIGKRHVPISVFLTVVFILGVILIVLVTKDTNKSYEITANGMKVGTVVAQPVHTPGAGQ